MDSDESTQLPRMCTLTDKSGDVNQGIACFLERMPVSGQIMQWAVVWCESVMCRDLSLTTPFLFNYSNAKMATISFVTRVREARGVLVDTGHSPLMSVVFW